jgi:DNA-nicking Smr family endonuclease
MAKGKRKRADPKTAGRPGRRREEEAGTFRPFEDLRDRVPAAPAAPPASRAMPARPKPPDDDRRAYEEAMHGVEAIPRAPAISGTPPGVPPREDEFAMAERFLSGVVDGEVPFDFADTDEYVEGSVRGFDASVLRRLRRGEYAVEGHLDLHGMDRREGKAAVRGFLDRMQEEGKRCVLVVHGRGLNSKDRIPVLKLQLRDWLSRGATGRRVLAFTSARPHDGGTGAVYVLLRRIRER